MISCSGVFIDSTVEHFFLWDIQRMSARSNSSDQDSCCEPVDAMAEQSPAKRARVEIEVPSFDKVDLEKFSVKDNGKGKNGHKAFPMVDGKSIRFNLTPTGWLHAPFGFDVTSKFEKPSFLGGKEPESGASEGLKLSINLQKAEAEFLSQLDDNCSGAFANIIKATWNPLVSENSLFGASSVKVVVTLKGEELTKIAVVANNKVTRGEGWDFLKEYIDSGNTFRNSEVKLTARVKKLWNVGGKAGIQLEATQIVLRPGDRPTEKAAFDDDSELLA